MEEFFGKAIGIIILFFAAGWFISAYPAVFWAILLVVIGFFVVRYAAKRAKAARELQAAEAARQAAEATRQAEHEGQIIAACNESVTAFEDIPKHLMSAEQLLDTADNEFQEGAFSPFWDSIERATHTLAAVDNSIRLIGDRFNRYNALVKSFARVPPPFPVDPASARRLGSANATAIRLQTIVRKAQRNFQFSTIYEQRKTSKILIAGFNSLGDAIHGLGVRLEESIDFLGDQISDLSSSMTEMNEKLIDTVKGVSLSVGDLSSQLGGVSSSVQGADKRMQAAMAEQAARQENANKMLDNIQRHRVPSPFAEH
jgi:methyl-accepting chemotaxis protein